MPDDKEDNNNDSPPKKRAAPPITHSDLAVHKDCGDDKNKQHDHKRSLLEHKVSTASTEATTVSSGSSSNEKEASAAASARDRIRQYTDLLNNAASEGSPFSDQEVDRVVRSVRNLIKDEDTNDGGLDAKEMKRCLQEIGHVSHKNWEVTDQNSRRLARVLGLLSTEGGISKNPRARRLLQRILSEGHWEDASAHAGEAGAAAAAETNSAMATDDWQPWAVLVTGVNGIRKTTSMYQPWFPQLLQEALIAPKSAAKKQHDSSGTNDDAPIATNMLPTGLNSFFRQLDHMICTLCNHDFGQLYEMTADLIREEQLGKVGDKDEKKNDEEFVADAAVVQDYANLKAALFTRYRTLSELLGAALLNDCIQNHASNCLMETSGRDVAMFHYVDHFFGNDEKDERGEEKKGKSGNGARYRKLALHFTINDLGHAQKSVDARMIRELKAGTAAKDTIEIVRANAGGPYGSHQLPSVQEASDRVWEDMVLGKGSTVGDDWYKATIQIHAHDTQPWTARAVRPDGTLGTVFTFTSTDPARSTKPTTKK